MAARTIRGKIGIVIFVDIIITIAGMERVEPTVNSNITPRTEPHIDNRCAIGVSMAFVNSRREAKRVLDVVDDSKGACRKRGRGSRYQWSKNDLVAFSL